MSFFIKFIAILTAVVTMSSCTFIESNSNFYNKMEVFLKQEIQKRRFMTT